jgi:hypothetical protein
MTIRVQGQIQRTCARNAAGERNSGMTASAAAATLQSAQQSSVAATAARGVSRPGGKCRDDKHLRAEGDSERREREISSCSKPGRPMQRRSVGGAEGNVGQRAEHQSGDVDGQTRRSSSKASRKGRRAERVECAARAAPRTSTTREQRATQRQKGAQRRRTFSTHRQITATTLQTTAVRRMSPRSVRGVSRQRCQTFALQGDRMPDSSNVGAQRGEAKLRKAGERERSVT